MEDMDYMEILMSECVDCGGYSEYPRALCIACMEAHNAKACEARPGSCHACNMIEMEGEDDVEL
jgi:uncharacterized OB-fold protein